MGLDLDTIRAFRGTNDLRRLVAAIEDADDHDEADWIEWKSTLDLASKDGCFHVVRGVLGMANRLPDQATLTCEGLGYVIVGAEPGSVAGIASVDPAQLDQVIEPYLGGADGPRWTPTYLPVDGKTVLVVTVEAPRPGDRIYTLRKEYGKYPSGTVFVRKRGRTVPADADDMDALQDRLAAAGSSGAELEVSVLGDVPLSWFDGTNLVADIDQWVSDRRDRLLVQAEAVERSRQPAPAVDDDDRVGPLVHPIAQVLAQQAALEKAMRAAASLESLFGEEDQRTLDDYKSELEDWTIRLRDAAVEGLPGLYVAAGHGVIAVQVRNSTGRFLPDVEVEVHFDWEPAIGLDEEPWPVRLPDPPREFGKRQPWPSLLAAIPTSIPPAYLNPPPIGDIGRRTWVEDGSIRVRFHLGNLRQHATDTSDEVYVLLPERPNDGVLHGTWTATIRDVEGILTGTIDVPVAENPVSISELLDRGPDHDN